MHKVFPKFSSHFSTKDNPPTKLFTWDQGSLKLVFHFFRNLVFQVSPQCWTQPPSFILSRIFLKRSVLPYLPIFTNLLIRKSLMTFKSRGNAESDQKCGLFFWT